MGVAWLDLPLGLACLLVALHQLRLLVARRIPAATAAAHAAMGLGMAAMFLPAADPVPRPVWVAVYAVAGAWFVVALLHGRSFAAEPAHHVVGAVAMLFMLLAGQNHAHLGTDGGAPQLLVTAAALALAAWFAADVVRILTRRPAPVLVRAGAAAPSDTAAPAPEPAGIGAQGAAHLVMDVAMVVMLLAMA